MSVNIFRNTLLLHIPNFGDPHLSSVGDTGSLAEDADASLEFGIHNTTPEIRDEIKK